MRVTLAGSNISGGISSRLPGILCRTEPEEACLPAFWNAPRSPPLRVAPAAAFPASSAAPSTALTARLTKFTCLRYADVISLVLI